MYFDDRIEQIAFQLQEELENTREKLKAVQDENAKLKTTIDLHRKADAEKTEKIKRLSEELDSLKYTNLILRTNAAECKLRLESLKDDEGFGDDQINISDEDWLKYRLSTRDAINTAVVNNLKNRIKDLENEIDQLKSNPSTVSDSELRAIHTADVETINKLNIKARDLNGTISTLLARVSKTDKENQELKKKVQDLNDFIQRI